MNQQTYMLDMYRAGVRAAADVMKASLENAQRIQNRQVTAVREALEESERSARDLGEARSIDEVVALQTRLASSNLHRTVELWSQLWQSAAQTQAAMIGQAQSQVGQFTESMRGSATNQERRPQERKSA